MALVAGLASAADGATTLGPARVIATEPDRVTVELADGRRAAARLALAFPYEPAEGDELLVIGNAAGHYVIGVLRGAGRTRMVFEGDVEIGASGGRLVLSSDEGTTIAGPSVEVRASRLRMIAGSVVQTFDSVRQTVRELLSTRAGKRHELVEGEALTHAKSARVISQEKVTINGREIFLG